MQDAQVSIRIDEEGNTHLDVKGVPGVSCTDLTELLVAGIGEVEEQQFTEEYCETLPEYVDNYFGESDE